MTLNELRDKAHAIAKEKGFWEGERSVGDLIALIHTEASEAFECYRDGDMELDWAENPGAEIHKPIGFPSEMADILIRVLDACGHLGIDIEDVVAKKMAYNETRPYRHGGKKA